MHISFLAFDTQWGRILGTRQLIDYSFVAHGGIGETDQIFWVYGNEAGVKLSTSATRENRSTGAEHPVKFSIR
jgi:hypothetical protein